MKFSLHVKFYFCLGLVVVLMDTCMIILLRRCSEKMVNLLGPGFKFVLLTSMWCTCKLYSFCVCHVLHVFYAALYYNRLSCPTKFCHDYYFYAIMCCMVYCPHCMSHVVYNNESFVALCTRLSAWFCMIVVLHFP